VAGSSYFRGTATYTPSGRPTFGAFGENWNANIDVFTAARAGPGLASGIRNFPSGVSGPVAVDPSGYASRTVPT